MLIFLLRRLLIAIPVLLGITMGTFLLISAAPGDPLLAYASLDNLDDAQLERARANLGLDQPLPVQYVRWLENILQGNFGRSLVTQRSVASEIATSFSVTVRLTLAALVVSSLVGIGVGVLSAVRQYSLLDYTFTFLSFLGLSVPGFFLALVLVAVFSLQLEFFPTSGMYTLTLPPDASAWDRFWDSVRYLVLPVITLSAANAASLARFTRSSVLEVLNQTYRSTARAKGLRERRVLWRHMVPNAMLPIITIIALRLPGLFGGSVIVETIFNFPGMGLLSVRAATDKDYPMIMGITLIFALLLLAANFAADILYAVFDPRVRYD
ncbi:MAG: ABC transporter permease [Aggregatilineales bacterium]